MSSYGAMTAGELRAAIADVPDDYLVMTIIDDQAAAWGRRVQLDHGARTVDVCGGRRQEEAA